MSQKETGLRSNLKAPVKVLSNFNFVEDYMVAWKNWWKYELNVDESPEVRKQAIQRSRKLRTYQAGIHNYIMISSTKASLILMSSTTSTSLYAENKSSEKHIATCSTNQNFVITCTVHLTCISVLVNLPSFYFFLSANSNQNLVSQTYALECPKYASSWGSIKFFHIWSQNSALG